MGHKGIYRFFVVKKIFIYVKLKLYLYKYIADTESIGSSSINQNAITNVCIKVDCIHHTLGCDLFPTLRNTSH